MKKSSHMNAVLEQLARAARALRLTDTEWAARAGIRKETLSRLRGRPSCDFSTIDALARATGSRIGVIEFNGLDSIQDGRFPASFERDYEEQLIALCESRSLDAATWVGLGPKFFMAGIAVMLASMPQFERRALLDLAEQLHAGSSHVTVFALWLQGSPLRPSRFLPMLQVNSRDAA
jgi:hypothetical protein